MSLTIVVINYHYHQSKKQKGNGGDPWTDRGEFDLNGMITSMDIRKATNVQIFFYDYFKAGEGRGSMQFECSMEALGPVATGAVGVHPTFSRSIPRPK